MSNSKIWENAYARSMQTRGELLDTLTKTDPANPFLAEAKIEYRQEQETPPKDFADLQQRQKNIVETTNPSFKQEIDKQKLATELATEILRDKATISTQFLKENGLTKSDMERATARVAEIPSLLTPLPNGQTAQSLALTEILETVKSHKQASSQVASPFSLGSLTPSDTPAKQDQSKEIAGKQ